MPTLPDRAPRWRPVELAAWSALFLVAATLNAGGYRYGVSDQAFYIPAVLHHVDASLFPRDWALLAPQDRLNVFTAVAGGVASLGIPIPALFFGLYVAGLLAILAAGLAIGTRLFRTRWAVVGLVFALTLRHAVAMGAVNTLEGYMHPRLIAFGLGSLAVASCLAHRTLLASAFLALAVACHPTTALWFVLWSGVALAVAEPHLRRPIVAAAAIVAAAGAWAVAAGPLAGRLVPMDEAWLSVVASKTYLFPTRWPVSGWLPAVLTPLTAAVLFALRRRRGLTTRSEDGVAAGAAVLFAVFLASIPFTAARLAFAVQLQVPRTLWMVDLLAVVYIVWYFAEGAGWRGRPGAARAAALVFIALSLGRGTYVALVQHPDRPVVRLGLPPGEWTDAMRWIAQRTDRRSWVLAPPGHAWQQGTSVRVAAQRDVYLEEAKDTAMALYSRDGAMTVLDRIRGAADFDALTAERARAMGPNLLVTEKTMGLPLLYSSGRFKVYRVR